MFINIKTEYSFGSVFGKVKDVVAKCKPYKFAGIADYVTTLGFVPFEKACIEANVKPIFGVTIPCCFDLDEKDRRGKLDEVTFIAAKQDGLKCLFSLLEMAYKQFWYTPRLTFDQVAILRNNPGIITIGGFIDVENTFDFNKISPATFERKRENPIATIENNFINESDGAIYQTFADERHRTEQTYCQHIPTPEEWIKICGNKKALETLGRVATEIEDVKLQRAPLVKCQDKTPLKTLIAMCKNGAKEKEIDLVYGEYAERYKRELKIIDEKGFVDYFLIVADLINYSKKQMAVGAGRGSSGGSLVCYLMGITMFDPIKYGLVFERFIDINRTDLPDIDIDFQDNKRKMVFSYLEKKYSVAQIANISRLTPKANLNRVAKHLFVPDYELTNVKNLTSDNKADAVTIEHLLTETEQGKDLVKSNPAISDCLPLEDHVLHSSVHAAGIIVSNHKITDYCGVFYSRKKEEGSHPIACVDMAGCEHQNLLKIDALGLKTLAVLADTCDQINKPYEWMYSIPDGDKKAYKLINSGRLTGVFQFEGRAIRGLLSDIDVDSINTIAAVSAIGRPGALQSGAAAKYIKRKNGKEKIELPDKHESIKEITKETFGVIVYQEQIMQLARQYAGMDWPDVILLRKVVGKSKGSEAMREFREKFVGGAKGKNGEKVWDMIKTFGGYGFVKAHAVAYAFITYWCAYLKAHFPLEFAVALLNNTNDDDKAVEILRFVRETEGIKHIPFDQDHSQVMWSVHKGKILGGLTSVHGIGIQSARKIVALRKKGEGLPPGIQKHIDNGISPFKYIYPRRELYSKYKGKDIIKLKKRKRYTIVGKITKMKMKDANAAESVKRRGGNLVEGNTTYLNLIVADDTGDMMCIINRSLYQLEGKRIAEGCKEGEDWVHLSGIFEPKMNLLMVDEAEVITI